MHVYGQNGTPTELSAEQEQMRQTCSRSMPASLSASSMQVDTPRPSARGSVMWYASHVMPPPRYSARMLAPRACNHQ